MMNNQFKALSINLNTQDVKWMTLDFALHSGKLVNMHVRLLDRCFRLEREKKDVIHCNNNQYIFGYNSLKYNKKYIKEKKENNRGEKQF